MRDLSRSSQRGLIVGGNHRLVAEHTSWGFEEGDEIVPGRHALRLLGGGRRYEAYLAWDDTLHALVAVKVVRPALVGDEGARRGIEGEAGLLERLSHPVIVRGFDAALEGDRPHLALEYLDGPRLSTLIRRHGVVLEQLVPLTLELCSAFHYLSTQGVVHLDVKPRNIVMSAPAPHRPERGEAVGGPRGASQPRGLGRLHGARAVRSGALRRARPPRRRLGGWASPSTSA